MDVTALVINYNAGKLLCECVQSILDNGIEAIRVVDNASTDGSLEMLEQQVDDIASVKIHVNKRNLGFGPAINAALAHIESRFVLIVNPDCRLQPAAAATLVAAMMVNEHAALAGPLVRDRDGQVEAATNRRFATPWRALMAFSGLARLGQRFPALAGVTVSVADDTQQVIPVEATSGACMLLRTGVVKELGGFDEAYGLHCEDLDLMFRLHEAGYQVLFVPTACAIHEQGISSASRPRWVHRQRHLGMARFFNQHLADDYAWPIVALVRTGIWLRWVVTWPLVALRG